MVENKTVGADSISARGTLPTAGRAHIECAPTAAEEFSSGAPAPRSTTFIIYYFLFIICNR
uniref:hypothetical protein n=1 Tax=Gemmiger formicilis TaxID=745368 RepID=UPI003FEDFC50